MSGAWSEEGGRVVLSEGGAVLFSDTAEHWREALLRLMRWSPEQGRAFAERAVSECGGAAPWASADLEARLQAMARAARALWPEPEGARFWDSFDSSGTAFLGGPLGGYWTRALAGDPGFALARAAGLDHGLLMRREGASAAPARPPEYEEEYFEGSQEGLGYGALNAQSGWRLEKSVRQADQLRSLLETHGALPQGRPVRLLDVGSGYGYLRRAAADLGWEQRGVELSRHACAMAKGMFGLETQQGLLGSFGESGFDCLTMMDLVEHVPDPAALLGEGAARLNPGGLLVVRTPNVLAAECEVFGHRYHSLKAEHLHCFSRASLEACFQRAGLEPVACASESHLLEGFLRGQAAVLSESMRGSDLFAAARKPR